MLRVGGLHSEPPLRLRAQAGLLHQPRDPLAAAPLLFLCAREDGPLGAVRCLLERPFTDRHADPLKVADPLGRCDALLQDLRNGIAVHQDGARPTLHPIIPQSDRDLMARFLAQTRV